MAKGTAAAFATVPGFNAHIGAALTLATQTAYRDAFKVVYLTSLAFTGTAIIACFFVTDINQYLTNFVNKTIHAPGKKGLESEHIESKV